MILATKHNFVSTLPNSLEYYLPPSLSDYKCDPKYLDKHNVVFMLFHFLYFFLSVSNHNKIPV